MSLLVVKCPRGKFYVYNGKKVIGVDQNIDETVPREPDGKWSKSRWTAALNNPEVQLFKVDGVSYTVEGRIN